MHAYMPRWPAPSCTCCVPTACPAPDHRQPSLPAWVLVCRQRQKLHSSAHRGSITKAVVGRIKQNLADKQGMAAYIKELLEEATTLVQAAGDSAEPKAIKAMELVPQLIARCPAPAWAKAAYEEGEKCPR